MANPASDFPTTKHIPLDVSGFGNSKLGLTTPTHTEVHGKIEETLEEITGKLGIGSATPVADALLIGNGVGSSAWIDKDTIFADYFLITEDDSDDITEGATHLFLTSAERTKLSGIATGATANSSDATLLARANHTGSQLASTISDFDTEVSNNTDVANNTANRHTHANKTLLDTYTQTDEDIESAIDDSHTHSNKAQLDLITDGDHDVRTDNPHSVTKAQVGLANVTNDAQIPLTQKGANSGVASLGSDGKVPTSQLPALALTEVSVVASQVAQLALTAQEGDVAIRSDENKSYIHNGGTAGDMTDWNELLTPTDSVLSVNGDTGAVTLDTDDIDEGGTNLYYTEERVSENEDVAANTLARHSHSNKALLDSYTQTEADIADAISKEHTHSNKTLLDTYDQTNADIADAISKEHTHSNKAILDATTASFLTADETKLDGIEAGAQVNTVESLSDLGITATATEINYIDGVTSAIQTQIDTKANDADVVHDTGAETIAGVKTFSSDPIIPDEAYGAGWNGSLEPATKNAIYDKIETMGGGGASTWGSITGTLSDQTDLQSALDDKADVTDLADYLPLTGGTVTGNLTVEGNYVVTDSGDTKSYRFRTSGTNLDWDFGGVDLYISGFDAADYSGDQVNFLVMSAEFSYVKAFQKWIWADSAGLDHMTLDEGGGFVFNEQGIDADFRVEGNNDTHLLFADGGAGFVGINEDTHDGWAKFIVGGGSRFDDDFRFGKAEGMQYITRYPVNTTNYDLMFQVRGDTLVMYGAGGIVINEGGASENSFRIESDADPNNFFSNAVNDRIGIGTNDPQSKLDVRGTVRVEGAGGLLLEADVVDEEVTINGDLIISGTVDGVDVSALATTVAGKQDTITGLTASGSELNILDGATLTTTELNYVDGVTSAIQTQLDGKQPLDSDLTTIAGLADPNADRILFWDDSAGAYAYLQASTGLVITTTSMTVRTTSETQTGIVELATAAEVATGTDTGRAVHPSGLATHYVKKSAVVTLTDGATPALNAALGNTFKLTAAGNRTIAVPSNPVDGQQIIIQHVASGGARTLSLNTGTGGFAFGTDITALTETASGLTDYIGCKYDSTANKWRVIAYVKGY